MKKPLTISDLAPAAGSRRNRHRIGRGVGSGNGKTSGKGHKGQGSRSGFSMPANFEGGQMPIVRRTPKSGFTSIFRVSYQPVNIGLLERFDDGSVVDPAALMDKGLIDGRSPVKILAKGELKKKLTVKAHAFSTAAKTAIEAAGGKTEILA